MHGGVLEIAPRAEAALPYRPYFATNGRLMSLIEEQKAWLEREGEQYALHGNCSIGRAALNTLVLDSPKVSRLHSASESSAAP